MSNYIKLYYSFSHISKTSSLLKTNHNMLLFLQCQTDESETLLGGKVPQSTIHKEVQTSEEDLKGS